MRDSELYLFLVLFSTAIILPSCIYAEDSSSGGTVQCEPDCSGDIGEFKCSSPANELYDDQCEKGILKYGSMLSTQPQVKIWYADESGKSGEEKYDCKDYYTENEKFTDYSSTHYFICRSDGCGGVCYPPYRKNEATSTKKGCQPWQECIDDSASKASNWPTYFTCGDHRDSQYVYGCVGGEDGSTGCRCNSDLCKGWCMDNAPVYDGHSGCSDYTETYKSQQQGGTPCELFFGGTCENQYTTTSKKSIEAPSASCRHYLCQGKANTACFIEATKKCTEYNGAYCQTNPLKDDPLCNSERFCDTEGKYWRIKASAGFGDCGNSDCCIPVAEEASKQNLQFDPKYTIVPDYHLDATSPALIQPEHSDRYSDDDWYPIEDAWEANLKKGGCYCNYLAIKDYYECDDVLIDDSHPCQNGNCAPDFVGGGSYCCPKDYCSHFNMADVNILCQNGDNWEQCKTGDYASDSNVNGQVLCFPNQKEVSYKGYRLTCDKGQWRNSQGCGETLFNYPLLSDLEPKISEAIRTNPIYGFRNSPIGFYVSRGKPTDIIAYAIPKAENAKPTSILPTSTGAKKSQVQISVLNSRREPVTDTQTNAEVKGDGNKQLVLKNTADPNWIIFTGDRGGAIYNLSIDCYTPDKSYCDPAKPDCHPSSYCVEDSPTNIAITGEKPCSRYEIEEGYWNDHYYPHTYEYRKVPKELKSQNCFYCCPKGYCAHKLTKDSDNVVKAEAESLAPLKSGEEEKLALKDAQGKEIPLTVKDADGNEIQNVAFELGDPKSICEVDEYGTIRFAAGLASGLVGSDAYDFTCKIKISYNSKKDSFVLDIPIEGLGGINGLLGKNKPPIIKPLTYRPWLAGSKKEFLLYDSEGDVIKSEITWSAGPSEICKLAATPDYIIFEGLKEGECIISAELSVEGNSQTITLTQNIVSNTPESDVKVYAEKTISASDDYTIECFPEGTHKLDGCNWVCKSGMWGKGGINNDPCDVDCDCNFNGETEYVCSTNPVDGSKKICCKAGECAANNYCVPEGHKEMIKGSLYVCRKGNWEGAGIRTDSDYSRAVLSEKKKEIEVNLEITKNDINTDEKVRAKVYHFFDKGAYSGNIQVSYLVSTEDKTNLLDENGNEIPRSVSTFAANEIIDNIIEIDLTKDGNKDLPVYYKAKITAPDASGGSYLTYLGSSLVVEVAN